MGSKFQAACPRRRRGLHQDRQVIAFCVNIVLQVTSSASLSSVSLFGGAEGGWRGRRQQDENESRVWSGKWNKLVACRLALSKQFEPISSLRMAWGGLGGCRGCERLAALVCPSGPKVTSRPQTLTRFGWPLANLLDTWPWPRPAISGSCAILAATTTTTTRWLLREGNPAEPSHDFGLRRAARAQIYCLYHHHCVLIQPGELFGHICKGHKFAR